jgi:type II secretory pathway pseudopilin PulG
MMRENRTIRTGGFTLLEMLIVISIIIILVAIVVGAGVGVVGGRKKSVTQNVLLTLDRALAEYIQINSAPPAFRAYDYAETPGLDLLPGDKENSPSVDNDDQAVTGASFAFTEYPTNSNNYLPRYPDAAVFVEQVQGYGDVDSILSGLERWLQPTPSSSLRGSYGTTQAHADETIPSVRDDWSDDSWDGNTDSTDWPLLTGGLVLYIHPSNHLAQALYGRCKNGRPYFMSAGPDGKFGTTNEFSQNGDLDPTPEKILQAIAAMEDNVYSYQPDPPLGVSGDDSDKEKDEFNRNYR